MFAFVPSPALSDIIQIANFDKKWNGDLLVGSLKDMAFFRIKLQSKHVIYLEKIKINHRIRSVTEHAGKLFLLTDEGSIIKVASEPAQIRFWKKAFNKINNLHRLN
jgi:glucose/arabinose dehydrogenase